MSKTTKPQIKVCIGRFAKEYGVSVPTFKQWVFKNPVLKAAFSPYINEQGLVIKKSLPPVLETLVYTTLGEP